MAILTCPKLSKGLSRLIEMLVIQICFKIIINVGDSNMSKTEQRSKPPKSNAGDSDELKIEQRSESPESIYNVDDSHMPKIEQRSESSKSNANDSDVLEIEQRSESLTGNCHGDSNMLKKEQVFDSSETKIEELSYPCIL